MNTNTRATSRTWKAHTTYRECGVVTGVSAHAVTITRTASGLRAEVDGVAVGVLEADRVLRAADRVEVIGETLEAGPIGKPAACELHRELGRLGFRDHYTTASEALARLVRLRFLHALAHASEIAADPCTPDRRTRARRADRIARACRTELKRMEMTA